MYSVLGAVMKKSPLPFPRLLRRFPLSCTPVLFLALASCAEPPSVFDPEKHDFLDRQQELSRDDYRHMLRPKESDKKKFEPYYEGEAKATVDLGEPPIPDISTVLAAPRPPAIGETQLVSIFVTEEVPLKDVLIELARLANVDVEIDSSIQGGIVFRAQNRPFNEVIERISSLAGLRYTMKDGVLRVERDTPKVKTYALDFLSFDRSATSDININTSVLSSGGGGSGGGGGEGLNTGSSAAVTYASEADFWERMNNAVERILGYVPANGASAGTANPAGANPGAAAPNAETFFVVNRQGGTLTVSATERQQRMIEQYLNEVRESTSAQVLIEAKIVEVSLDEQYYTGINWNEVFRTSPVTLDVDYNSVPTTNGLTQILIGGDSATDASLDAIVNATQQFGTSRTLSSPRIHAMNNQQAVLTFAQNLVYFDIDVERETDTNSSSNQELFSVEAEAVTVPVGIIIALQPAINTKTNEVTLSIRPTLSRTNGTVSDPSVAFIPGALAAGISNEIPIIEVREMDSLMRMKSGQVMVLGGLMEQVGNNTDTGVPFLSGVPWIGNAFKNVAKQEEVRELFILVRATIIGNSSNLHDADKTLYQKFNTDHRPLAF